MTELHQLLKDQGFRLTRPRTEILKVLEAYPHTVQELQTELTQKQIKVDLASIYRTLELLQKLHVVQAVDLGEGKKRFKLTHHHHHHIICNSCGSIEDISINEQLLLQEITQQSQFEIINHTLEFFGLCPNCQIKKP